jgi:hypothetical protein
VRSASPKNLPRQSAPLRANSATRRPPSRAAAPASARTCSDEINGNGESAFEVAWLMLALDGKQQCRRACQSVHLRK